MGIKPGQGLTASRAEGGLLLSVPGIEGKMEIDITRYRQRGMDTRVLSKSWPFCEAPKSGESSLDFPRITIGINAYILPLHKNLLLVHNASPFPYKLFVEFRPRPPCTLTHLSRGKYNSAKLHIGRCGQAPPNISSS